MTVHDPGANPLTLPRRPLHAPAAPPDLDAQIAHLEQRLVAREAWVLSTAQSLGQRAQQAVTVTSWVLPTLGGAAVLWLGWRWWCRRTTAPLVSAPSPVHGSVHRSSGLAAVPWTGLVALGWPLLPTVWRERFSPAAATAAVSTVLVIVRRLVGRRVR